jgi:hypothetical protein
VKVEDQANGEITGVARAQVVESGRVAGELRLAPGLEPCGAPRKESRGTLGVDRDALDGARRRHRFDARLLPQRQEQLRELVEMALLGPSAPVDAPQQGDHAGGNGIERRRPLETTHKNMVIPYFRRHLPCLSHLIRL